jgi:SAM-dependent methyltransferase
VTGSAARPQYTFGDTPLAVDRLRLVASVFDASSRAFLAAAVPRPPRVAIDVGCGPGVSTRLVAEVTGAGHTVGIDSSPTFLEVAATGAPAGLDFVRYDVTSVPLPVAPADLVYCRLLLAHLPDPAGLVGAWATQLTAVGRLLLDEIEWMEVRVPEFVRYEEIVLDLVGSRGAPMYAGPIVDAVREGAGWRQTASALRSVPVSTAAAARMFAMNLATWRSDPHIREHYDPDDIERLRRDLATLTHSAADDEIVWGMRQVVYEPTGRDA